jgi:HEAT repeat protein
MLTALLVKPIRRTKLWLFLSLAALGGLVMGVLLYSSEEILPEAKPKPVSRLIRDLQKQDSMLDKSWQATWSRLPDPLTRRIRQLEPSSAAEIRREAAKALVGRGPEAQQAVPALIAALNDPIETVQLNVIAALAELGSLAEMALPDLLRLFKSTHDATDVFRRIRLQASLVLALGSIGGRSSQVAELLSEALKSEEPANDTPEFQIRGHAVRALEKAAKENPSAASILVTALQETDQQLTSAWTNAPWARPTLEKSQVAAARRAHNGRILFCESIIEALGRIGGVVPEIIPILIVSLQSKEERIRQSAVVALGQAGSRASQAVPALSELLVGLRETHFDRNGDAPMIRIMENPMRAQWQYGWTNGPRVFGMTDTPGTPLAERLRSDFRNQGFIAAPVSNLELRRLVVETLAEIRPSSKESVPALIDEYMDPASPIRLEAAWARWRIDGQMNAIRPILVEGLSAPQTQVRRNTSDFLGRFGTDALSELVRAATNEDSVVRWIAVSALRGLGPAASNALPTLKKALGDSNHSVRIAAEQALTNIQANLSSSPLN